MSRICARQLVYGGCRKGTAYSCTAVAIFASNERLREADPPVLAHYRIAVRKHALDIAGIFDAAVVPRIPQSAVRARDDVHENHDAPRAADGEGGQETVGAPDEGHERVRGEGRDEARELPEVSAGKLRADDVGVCPERGDRVGVEIEPRGHLGEVVHHDRDRRYVGHLL